MSRSPGSVARKLFGGAVSREVQPMVLIAAGLFLVLVTADILDLSARKANRANRARIGG